MPWLQSATATVLALEPKTAPVPYGRALSTLRHKYDGAIKGYFESLHFSVKSRPEVAHVAAVFLELCRRELAVLCLKKPNGLRYLIHALTMPTKNHSRTLLGSCTPEHTTSMQ
jgi:hypothetical protein